MDVAFQLLKAALGDISRYLMKRKLSSMRPIEWNPYCPMNAHVDDKANEDLKLSGGHWMPGPASGGICPHASSIGVGIYCKPFKFIIGKKQLEE